MSFALWKRFGKQMIILEVACIGTAYYVFSDLNNNVESRRKMAERAPWLMDAFYSVTGHSANELGSINVTKSRPTVDSVSNSLTSRPSCCSSRRGGEVSKVDKESN